MLNNLYRPVFSLIFVSFCVNDFIYTHLVEPASNFSLNLPQICYQLKIFPLHIVVGLYNGFGWLALGRISGVGARFGTYEILTAFYKGIFVIIITLKYSLHPGVETGDCSKTLYFNSLDDVLEWLLLFVYR